MECSKRIRAGITQKNNSPSSVIDPFTIKCSQSKSLNIASLNVCGLRHRVLYPDFFYLVAKYDIFCVSETKLDNFDIIDIPCFDFVSQVRKQKYLRKSGGIGVFINKSISKQVTVLDSESVFLPTPTFVVKD